MRWCRRKVKINAVREDIKKKVVELLNSSERVPKGGKIVLFHNGIRVGFIKEGIPLESIEIQSYWESRMGIKVEISYGGEFMGIVFLRDGV